MECGTDRVGTARSSSTKTSGRAVSGGAPSHHAGKGSLTGFSPASVARWGPRLAEIRTSPSTP